MHIQGNRKMKELDLKEHDLILFGYDVLKFNQMAYEVYKKSLEDY